MRLWFWLYFKLEVIRRLQVLEDIVIELLILYILGPE